jgi:hypothetical protein
VSRGIHRSVGAVCVVALLADAGCSRLVTRDPATVARLDDSAWRIQTTPAAPVTPLPFRARPEVAEALRSPPDDLGVPVELYAVDPLLGDHRREMASQARARHSAATGIIVFGVVFGALSATGLVLGAHDLHSSDSTTHDQAAQTIFWSSVLGAFSLGEIVAGVVLAATRSDPRALQSYFRETYSEPR